MVLLIVLTLLGIYLGSWRTLVKGKKYIIALGGKGKISSVEQFKKIFGEVLEYRAPVSDDEIIKFIGGDVIDMISGNKQNEEVSRELLSFIEERIDKNDILHLLNTGRSYHFLWINHGRKDPDFQKAEEYYTKVLEKAPKLPPALYGMLDLYRVRENAEKIYEYGNRILEIWPKDERVSSLLETVKKIEKQKASTTDN